MLDMTTRTAEHTTDLDRVVSATVTALYRGRGLTRDDLREAIGVSYGTMVSRLQGRTQWTMYEVYTLAQFFDVRIGDLTSGLGGVFPMFDMSARRNNHHQRRNRSAPVEAIADAVRSLPRTDSNRQPAGCRELTYRDMSRAA